MPITLPFFYKKELPSEKTPPSRHPKILWVFITVLFNIFLAASAIFIADRIGKPTPIPPGRVPACDRVSISGYVFNDTNRNKQWDKDEPPLGGWKLSLEAKQNVSITDDQGYYAFLELLPGLYTIVPTVKEGWEPTLIPETIVYLEKGARKDDLNLGYVSSIADISIVKVADKDQVSTNEQITYTLTYKNEGWAAAEEVTITDTIPEHTIFISASDGGEEISPGVIFWTIGTLQPQIERTASLTVNTNTDLAGIASLLNTIAIQTTSREDNLENNTDVVETSVLIAQTHKECLNEQCVEVAGAGVDECVVDSDCLIPEPTPSPTSTSGPSPSPAPSHRTCVNNLCLVVSGEGQDTCNTASDCAYEAPRVHKICRNGQCLEVPGEGDSECISNYDCAAETGDSGLGGGPSTPPASPSGVPATAWVNPTLTILFISFLLVLLGVAI